MFAACIPRERTSRRSQHLIYARRKGPIPVVLKKSVRSYAAATATSLCDRLEQRSRPDAEGFGQGDDVEQAEVALAAFDAADVVAVQAGELGELLLGEAALHAELADARSEEHARILGSRGGSHLPIVQVCTL